MNTATNSTNFVPKISIIILNYNSAESTITLLDQLQMNVEREINYIVVDNDSSDDSQNLLSDYAASHKLVFIETGYNGGYAYGNNIGIANAEKNGSDFVLIMNSDITVQSDIVTPLVDFMVSHEACGIVSPVLETSEGHISYGRRTHLGKIHAFSEVVPEGKQDYVSVDAIVGACYMVRMSAISLVGKLPESYYLNFEETEWCLRFKRQGYDVVSLPAQKVFHQNHGSIGKISGLQTYFLRRNLVLFNRRMGNLGEKLMFFLKIIPFGFVQSLKRHSLEPLKAYWDGVTEHNRYAP